MEPGSIVDYRAAPSRSVAYRNGTQAGTDDQRARSWLATAACAHWEGSKVRGDPPLPEPPRGDTGRSSAALVLPRSWRCRERDVRDCSADVRRNPPCLIMACADM